VTGVLFVLTSFEGPDVYSQAGGLGVRMKELSRALAEQGHETHLFFVGDPSLPDIERQVEGRLVLHRWCQWISAQHPAGVYDGEEGKLADWNDSLPTYIIDRVIEPALASGRQVVVLAEEWQTSLSTILISQGLRMRGLRERVVVLWNANNVFGFHRVNWILLDRESTLTTVSRYMKHLMWQENVNPIVIPNGIPAAAIAEPPAEDVSLLRTSAGGDLFLFKIGRFDPDKRWLMAVDAAIALKGGGTAVRMLIRGGKERHGGDVLRRARQGGLRVAEVRGIRNLEDLAAGLRAEPNAELLAITSFLPPEMLGTIYRSADAVLANSGHEPFGLVGLEVMAAGGLAVTGSTGEDYAEPFRNAVVLETDDPHELVTGLRMIQNQPRVAARLRKEGVHTARAFTWTTVIEQLFIRLELAAARQRVSWPAPRIKRRRG
jgi:glycosyltransferase involved in cell wall biosynthesis